MPETPETAHTSLEAAMLAFQSDAPTITKGETAKVESKRTGKTHTYKYADLGDIIETCQPLLTKHGLLWRTFPSIVDGKPALRYKVSFPATKEYEEDTMLVMLASPDSQAHGSGLTYCRRYAFVAAFNLATEDDDGKAASTSKVTQIRTPAVQSAPDRKMTEEELALMVEAVKPPNDMALLLASVGADGLDDLTVLQGREIIRKARA
jgi:hypothetical protein